MYFIVDRWIEEKNQLTVSILDVQVHVFGSLASWVSVVDDHNVAVFRYITK